ncbi:hypothetical protein [Maridesulfovibrio ferrireducens]|uniref:hypothetical protein n=1 Tax=Maridesulfovibrio ferrireducens TaxID=246191 RepID=UPI001A1F926F|nr:hypothetical protein [Maridesulfovibrio ferrireducens]MBI9109891.1 hypothetical protein [Maridesulfovibrio ferrireducens]
MSDLRKQIPNVLDISPENLKWLTEVWSAYTRVNMSKKNVLDMLKMAEMLCGAKQVNVSEQLHFLHDLPEEPILQQFWNIVEKHWVDLNHKKNDYELAINLNQFMNFCEKNGYTGFDRMTLIKWLPYSQQYQFMERNKAVRSCHDSRAVKCYIFKKLQ